jgi:ornithine--oxo-acid transaminase
MTKREWSITTSQEAIETHERYIVQTYRPHEFVYARGRGVWVWNPEGERKMEMLSCYSALGGGHCHKDILRAFVRQARRYWPGSNAFYNDVAPLFAKELVEFCEMAKVLPINTGAEAVERAIKIARKWGYTCKENTGDSLGFERVVDVVETAKTWGKKTKGIPLDTAQIILCDNNFHGRTITVISASSHDKYKRYFGPLTPGFTLIPYGDLAALEKAITPYTVAFLAEPIQGEGGVVVPPEGYLKGAKRICEKRNVLLVWDEIQTGLGRCGKRFAYQYEDAKPDILVLGKFLGGGPGQVSAAVCNEKVASVLAYPEDGSTFQCHPIDCAAALAALRLLQDEGLPERAFELGNYFRAELEKMKSTRIKEIRGKGLLIGIELKHELGGAKPFVTKLIEEGILCNQTREHTIRLAPPLVITRREIDWALKRLKKVLAGP